MKKYVQFSDLPFKAGSYGILLFQPETTVKAGIKSCGGREFMEQAFKDAINLTGLIHVCSLACDGSNDELGGPYALGPQCGGRLTLRSTQSIDWMKQRRINAEVALTCSNPACNMEVISTECPSKSDLSNLLLHLALKQMIPNLPAGNYLNCALKEDNHRLQGDKADAIRALGLIALAPEILWGYVQNGYFQNGTCPVVECFGFGFMLVPGMQTASGCGGYDEWLKLLVEKKFESLKEVHRSLAPFLLGPKSSQK